MQPHCSQQRIEGPKNDIEDLKRLQRNINSAAQYMLRQVKHEDATIFIGSTRSGKSTLINYLIGNSLIGERVSDIRPVSIKKLDDPTNTRGPKIGAGPTSDTVIPSKWNSRQPLGFALWDVPGFDDNRGVVQDITNAYYVYELFKNLKSAKIVLVTDINDIAHDNIRPFLSLLNSVEKLLNEKIRECFPAITIILSKVPKEISGFQADKNYINRLLDYQFLSSSSIDISEPAKDLVRHLIRNNQKIGLFKQAILGEITDAIINEGIFEAIQSASSISEEILKQVSPSITNTSGLFLFQVREQLCDKKVFVKLQDILTTVLTACEKHFDMTNDNKMAKEALPKQLEKLEIFESKLLEAIDSTSFDKKVDAIRMIDPSIGKYIDVHNLLQAARLMEFCDQLLHLKESKVFNNKLQDILKTALSNVKQSMIKVRFELALISKEEAECQSAELERKYKKEHEELLKENELVKKHNAEMSRQLQTEANEMGIYIKLGFKGPGLHVPII